ncbi:MAG: adenosine deaminase [Clostridium sp.]|nr:adenosine deaminase [Clostridium sp.]
MYYGRFYLDKEKDLIVSLYKEGEEMNYVLSTPNHHSGNLITNLAKLCDLPLSRDEEGLLVIRGRVPCYITAYNEEIYIFRLGGTKVANIYPDGRIEMKASIPSLSKTLMSQTKDYRLDIAKTIIKTYIFRECKFRTDLHTHMNANLAPDILIALGIYHQIRYPLYYIRKLGLRLPKEQSEKLARRRKKTAKKYSDSPLTGKYLDRKIDDNTFINFAELILQNLENAEYNIPRIRASLAVMKDGQAVFTNLEKVYLYRYVFTKGQPSGEMVPLTDAERIPDPDIAGAVLQMQKDHQSGPYRDNTLFQDKLLWTARSYASKGIRYVEISDTTLVKKDGAPEMLRQVHQVMPAVMEETGVMLRFLAGIRRIPLTIVKDNIAPAGYLMENLQVLRAVAIDPYVAGSDILGEEINDIRDIRPVIREITEIADQHRSFVIRIHAGENDSLRDNVANSIQCVLDSMKTGQKVPHIRIGHGLYTSNLQSPKGKQLIKTITDNQVVLEFQITSNVRLNNLSMVERHPLKDYLAAGIPCVQGTDGGALYGTDSIDEQLALEKLLSLTKEELLAMRRTEDLIMRESEAAFREKNALWRDASAGMDVKEFFDGRIRESMRHPGELRLETDRKASAEVFAPQIGEMPPEKMPVIVAGGSFNNDRHKTTVLAKGRELIDNLLEHGDPEKICFVIGHEMKGYERYLVQKNRGRFEVFAFVPCEADPGMVKNLSGKPVKIRVAIEPSSVGIYKSIAYEIFKRRTSVLLALDGNSAAVNLMQEAKNAKKKCRTYVNPHARMLFLKAKSLRGYVTMLDGTGEMAEEVLAGPKESREESKE